MPEPTADRHFVFLLASARRGGNTEQLARIAAESLPPNVKQQWVFLRDLALPPFEDFRHTEPGYAAPVGSERTIYDATLACTCSDPR